MSETPRTDQSELYCQERGWPINTQPLTTTFDSMRILERDLTASQARVRVLEEAHAQVVKLHHDLIVVMQAAFIEWRYGKGADAAMGWISNTLDGPGLIPSDDEPWGREAQAYYDANRAEPFPQCFCGKPSNQLWMGKGFCSEAHYKQARAALGETKEQP